MLEAGDLVERVVTNVVSQRILTAVDAETVLAVELDGHLVTNSACADLNLVCEADAAVIGRHVLFRLLTCDLRSRHFQLGRQTLHRCRNCHMAALAPG